MCPSKSTLWIYLELQIMIHSNQTQEKTREFSAAGRQRKNGGGHSAAPGWIGHLTRSHLPTISLSMVIRAGCPGHVARACCPQSSMRGEWNLREAQCILRPWSSGQDARATWRGHAARLAHALRMIPRQAPTHSLPMGRRAGCPGHVARACCPPPLPVSFLHRLSQQYWAGCQSSAQLPVCRAGSLQLGQGAFGDAEFFECLDMLEEGGGGEGAG